MKRILIAMATVFAACATDTCPNGLKMDGPGACTWPETGGKGGSTQGAAGHISLPSSPDVGGSAGVGGKLAVGGSGGKAADASADDGEEREPAAAGSGGKEAADAGEPDRGGHGGGGSGGEVAGSMSLPTGAGTDAGAVATGGMQAPPPPPAPRCGDGRVDPGEACDGNCPTSCTDDDPCTKDVLTGHASSCDVVCTHVPIMQAVSGDMCCPAGATYATDKDCPQSCGDGVISAGETCDGNCPMSCDDGNACTADSLTGSATMCNAKCTNTPIAAPKSGDGCCPSGANAANDSDCKPVCGNGVKEGSEVCDGDCPTDCASSGCTVGMLSGSAATCDAVCKTTTITAKVDGDGCCPPTADYNSDNDCAPPPGCTPPSAGNMILNPGFATGLTHWDESGSYGTVGWTSGDYEGCSVSGSALLTANNQVGRVLSQCIPATGGHYFFSVRIKSGGNGGQVTCAVAAYQIAGCQGQGKAEAEADWLNVEWGPVSSQAFDVDSSFQSLLVACYINAKGVEQDATAEVDELYLGHTDAAF